MNQLSITSFVVLILTFALSLGFPWNNVMANQAHADTAYAVATWTERNGDEYIIIARFCEELVGKDKTPKWSPASIVHRSKQPVTSSNLVTLSDGTQLLFWAEYRTSKSSIKYKSKPFGADNWGNVQDFHNEGTENIGVNLIRNNQKIWSFWASTDQQLPDIRYRVFDNGVWQESKRLHPANSVPDIQPIAEFNEKSELVVRWLSYSFLQSSYIQSQKILPNDFENHNQVDIINVDKFEIPDFLPFNQAVTLRFPKNHFKQSYIVTSPASNTTQ